MRNVAVLTVSLVVALTGAYLTWTREAEEPSDEVVEIYDAREADIAKVHWKSDTLDVTIEKRKDERGEYYWVDSTETKTKKKRKNDPHDHPDTDHPEDEKGEKAKGEKAKGEKAKGEKADPAEPDPAEPAPEPEEPDVVEIEHLAFVASAAGADLWKSVAPLQAMRELQAPTDPATFGLAEPKATLEVVRSAGPLTLEIGGETYGAKDRYVRYQQKVFLVDDAKLKPLESAGARLMERSLFPLEQKEIDRLEVATPTGPVVWNQVNKEDATKAAWARKETPEVSDDVGATWINKLLGLKLQTYVDPADVPETLVPVFSYTIASGKDAWRVEVSKGSAEPAVYYAKSDFNRTLVKLTESQVRNVVDDLGSLAPTAP